MNATKTTLMDLAFDITFAVIGFTVKMIALGVVIGGLCVLLGW